jgi:DNA repair photolyase
MPLDSITRKTLLYKTAVTGSDYCINHVLGCSHGCRYPCYALLMKRRFGQVHSYADWCRPKIVRNALELLDREIPRYKQKIKSVHLCFSTDPFMFRQEEVAELSLSIIARLNRQSIPCNVLTKGIYPEEVMQAESANCCNEYGITLVSLSEEFRKEYEPGSAPIGDRIAGLERLQRHGARTWVIIEPYPTPNIFRQNLRDILEAVSFVQEIIFGGWNYSTRPKQFLGRNDFYDSQVEILADFCKKSKIRYSIIPRK